MSTKTEVDPILAEVVANLLLSVSDELGLAMITASHSPNIRERRDCSTCIFGPEGQIIAQAPFVPMHLGSMVGLIDEVLKRFPKDKLKPGDMFLANDPYRGGGAHLPDITAVSPVFYEDSLVAFVADIAHHADVGGMVPGSESAACKTIYEEGIRLPPVRVYPELGEDDGSRRSSCPTAVPPRSASGTCRPRWPRSTLGSVASTRCASGTAPAPCWPVSTTSWTTARGGCAVS